MFQSDALVNVANLQGNTALHEAVRGGHQAVVELLLKAGASPGIRNKRQRTPLDCAYELGGKVILQKPHRAEAHAGFTTLFCAGSVSIILAN